MEQYSSVHDRSCQMVPDESCRTCGHMGVDMKETHDQVNGGCQGLGKAHWAKQICLEHITRVSSLAQIT